MRGGGRGHLLTEAVTDLSAKEAREAVDVAASPGVEYVGTVSTLEDQQLLSARAIGAVRSEMEEEIRGYRTHRPDTRGAHLLQQCGESSPVHFQSRHLVCQRVSDAGAAGLLAPPQSCGIVVFNPCLP